MAGAGADRAPRLAVPTPFTAGVRKLPLRTATVLQVVLLLLLIANLGRIPVFSTGDRDAPILVNDLAVAVLLLTGFVAMLQQRSLRLDRVAFSALAFAAVGFGATLLAIPRYGLTGVEVAVSTAYLARWLFYFCIYVVVVNAVSADDVDAVWGALEKMILAFAVFGIIQVIFFPGFAQMVYPESRPYADWDPQGRRLVSTFLDPNFAGALILVGLLVQFGKMAAGAAVHWWKPLVLFAALVLTLSRSSFLALIVAGGILLVTVGLSRRLVKWGFALLVLILAALPKLLSFAAGFNKLTIEDASAMSRVVMWLRGLQVFADNPVFGIGFNTWGYVQERYGWDRFHAASYGIEGGLLFIGVLTGVVGLALYMTVLVLVMLRGRRVWRDLTMTPSHRGLAVGALATAPMIVVHSLFTNSLLLPFLMETLWVVWGLVAVLEASRPAPLAGHVPLDIVSQEPVR